MQNDYDEYSSYMAIITDLMMNELKYSEDAQSSLIKLFKLYLANREASFILEGFKQIERNERQKFTNDFECESNSLWIEHSVANSSKITAYCDFSF